MFEVTPTLPPTRQLALSQLTLALQAALTARAVVEIWLDWLHVHLVLDGVTVLRLRPNAPALEMLTARGLPLRYGEHPSQPFSDTNLVGRVLLNGQGQILTGSAACEGQPEYARRAHTAYELYAVFPLGAAGVLEIFQHQADSLSAADLHLAQISAARAALALDHAERWEALQHANVDLRLGYEAILEGWARSLDLRCRETEGHTLRVTDLTLRLARAMGVPEAALTPVRQGALLHDIGKAGLPESVLLKAGLLNDDEWQLMCQHPRIAYDLLYPIPVLRPALDIPYCHHERWDGTGYPRGLRGEQIPLAARIFSVADVWDALQSDRPYRPGQIEKQVREYIVANRGTHFDPAVVDALVLLTQPS